MRLQDFLEPQAVSMALAGDTKEAVLDEMVGLLRLDPRSAATLGQLVRRREQLGSTGFGRGIAIPHARSLVVNRLRVAFGRHPGGIDYAAMDHARVHSLFLIVAPPHEVSNQYLPVLGKVAQFCQAPDIPGRLATLTSADDLFRLLDERGI